MKRVEFFGPPGGGKTTLKDRLIDELWQHEIQSWDFRSLPFIARFSLLSPKLIQRILRTDWYRESRLTDPIEERFKESFVYRQLDSTSNEGDSWQKLASLSLSCLGSSVDDPRLQYSRIKWFFRGLAAARFADRERRDEWVFFDDGVLQRALSICVSENDMESLETYVYQMPEPKLAVQITASPEILERRLVQREGEENRFLELIEIARQGTERCMQILRDRDIPVISMRADEKWNSQVTHLVEYLKKH